MALDDYQPDLMALGAFVRTRRLQLGLTQGELAHRLETAQERISQVELGQSGLPRLSTLAALADALETRLGDLLDAAGYRV